MTERLLQFIWQFQYFSRNELIAVNGEKIQVIDPGIYNYNQGPDFGNAKINVDGTTWAGTIELHLRTSDWYRHGHQDDKNYDNVILHVVWEHDASQRSFQQGIPIIELRTRIAKILLQRYTDLMHSSSFIACERSITTVKPLTWTSWKERLIAERLLRRAGVINGLLVQNNFHWEETFWWLLARNFGMKVNADTFEAMARSVPITMLARHKSQIHQLEALLLGQAGMLNAQFSEDYPGLLQKEYRFLQNKYGLVPVKMPLHSLRMRPANFPSLRLAQLAMLVQQSSHLFSRIKEVIHLDEIRSFFAVTANDYWHYHYQFDEPSPFKPKQVGASMIDNIIVNTLAPILFTYGEYLGDQRYREKAIRLLEETAPEKNTITNGFEQLAVGNKNACDSQALIELKNEYCSKKRCLECAVGSALLRQ